MIVYLKIAGVAFMFGLLLTLCGCGKQEVEAPKPIITETAAWTSIDSHAHLYLDELDKTSEDAFIVMLGDRNMSWFSICTHGLEWDFLQKQVELCKRMQTAYPSRVAWATSFNLENWGEPDWESSALEFIADGFDNGALAVKIWKEVGMVLTDPDGSYVMVDDPRFDPIFDLIEASGKTLVCHIGEPRNCWLPLEEMTVNGDRNYFKSNPEYHAYLHPEIPDYWRQIESRDNVLAKHPGMKVVGCHLGSLEYDTDEVANRLDKYPNFAVDMAARIIHFKVQDRDKVRDFIIKYQDRLLYATDIALRSTENLDRSLERWSEVYKSDWAYFATDKEFTIPESETPIRGLALPPQVLKKIFETNAKEWYPGMFGEELNVK